MSAEIGVRFPACGARPHRLGQQLSVVATFRAIATDIGNNPGA